MSDSRALQLVKGAVRVDPTTAKLIEHAQKAERYDAVVTMLKEIELLELDIVRQRKSRAQSAAVTIIALDAKIGELRLLISTIIARAL